MHPHEGMDDKKPFSWDDIRRIADEIELKVHLAGMEARERWQKLQPHLDELQKTIQNTGQKASDVLDEQLAALGKGLRKLRDDIGSELDRRRPSA